jgi:hypothetical protein
MNMFGVPKYTINNSLIQECVPHDLQPVLQPAIASPQGFPEGVEGVVLVLVLVALKAQSGEAAVPLPSSTLQLLSLMNKAQGKRSQETHERKGDKGRNSKFNEEYAPGRPATQDPRESALPRSARC